MSPLLTLAAALSSALAAPFRIDLDGDGKPESLVVEEDGVRLGRQLVVCGGPALCRLEAADIDSTDKRREVVLIDSGPRDDSVARLYHLDKGQLVPIPFSREGAWFDRIETNGNGIVLTDSRERLYMRREKWVPQGGVLTLVPQPFWYVGFEADLDRTAPILREPGGAEVVANIRPKSRITVLLESADKADWFLVRISSGLTGWISLEGLRGASDQVAMIYAAG